MINIWEDDYVNWTLVYPKNIWGTATGEFGIEAHQRNTSQIKLYLNKMVKRKKVLTIGSWSWTVEQCSQRFVYWVSFGVCTTSWKQQLIKLQLNTVTVVNSAMNKVFVEHRFCTSPTFHSTMTTVAMTQHLHAGDGYASLRQPLVITLIRRTNKLSSWRPENPFYFLDWQRGSQMNARLRTVCNHGAWSSTWWLYGHY